MKTTLPPTLLTGHREMDEQHGAILDAVERLFRALLLGDRGQASALLVRLHDELVAHQTFEEVLMAKHFYPLQATHKAAHAVLMRQLRALQAELRAAGPSRELLAVAKELLEEYLASHIRGSDRDLVRFVGRGVAESSAA